MKRSRAGALLVALAMAAGGEGCRRSHASVAKDPAESSIVVRADSEGLLLTWIDDKGDFHVETRVPDVPMMGRDAVRVVDPNRDDGTHADNVFVVDLRQARADGTYPVRGMTRAEFEAFAVARREKVGPTLGGGPTQAPSSSTAQDAPEPGPARPSARAVVVIYGAEWCGACHDAARYLRSKGIAYVEKDIDKDPAAAREMQEKLAKRGLRGGSIPVLDVRGKVMIGFNPAEIDAALGDAL